MQATRRVVIALRARLLAPLQLRFDTIETRLARLDRLDELDRLHQLDRLEQLEQRLGELRALLVEDIARTAALSERTIGVGESETRLAGRLEEIERLLGGGPVDSR